MDRWLEEVWDLPDLLGSAGALALAEVLQSGVDTLKK